MSTSEEIPYYYKVVDWDRLVKDYPPPPFYGRTVGRMPAAKIRDLQNQRFMARVGEAWNIPFYRKRWSAAGLARGDIKSLDDIRKIPIFNSDDLKDAAQEGPPFGSHHPFTRDQLGKVPLKLQSSGGTTGMPRLTLFDPYAWEIQGIQTARAFYAQGVRPGDVVQTLLTTSLANAGWCSHLAAYNWLGAMSATTGSGVVTSSERQLQLAAHIGTNFWFGTAEYLGRLVEVSKQIGIDLKSLPTHGLATLLGVDTDGSVRRQLEQAWGAPVYDCWGTHEVGWVAFECERKDGRHIQEDMVYIEVVDVDSGDVLGYGEEGNIVATALHRSVPPFIRYNIRDKLQLFDRSECACGLCTPRLSTFLGRSDEMVKLRGTNMYPMACLPVVARDERSTGEFICVAYYDGEGLKRREEMVVKVERRSPGTDAAALQADMEAALHRDLGVRVGVQIVEAGSLVEHTKVGGEGKTRRLLDLRKTGGRP